MHGILCPRGIWRSHFYQEVLSSYWTVEVASFAAQQRRSKRVGCIAMDATITLLAEVKDRWQWRTYLQPCRAGKNRRDADAYAWLPTLR